jgi:carbonic anhydrase/acetyltransferase-like protein (isoleucine patch superfamily)
MKDTRSTTRDMKLRLELFVLLDGFIRLTVWASSLAFTAAVLTYSGAWPQENIVGGGLSQAWRWTQALANAVLLFNFFYILHLVVLRLLIPTPKAGSYEIGPGKTVDRQLVWSALVATLTKARYEPPFPGFLVFHMANLAPLKWLMSPIFGPKSKSCYVIDPTILDPHNVSIGRNVVIGFGTTIAAHYQERNSVCLKPTIIEDDVLIGGHCALSGVHIQRGAVIGAGSIVLPGSVIGPGEYWSGNPARRRREAPRPEDAPGDPSCMTAQQA